MKEKTKRLDHEPPAPWSLCTHSRKSGMQAVQLEDTRLLAGWAGKCREPPSFTLPQPLPSEHLWVGPPGLAPPSSLPTPPPSAPWSPACYCFLAATKRAHPHCGLRQLWTSGWQQEVLIPSVFVVLPQDFLLDLKTQRNKDANRKTG